MSPAFEGRLRTPRMLPPDAIVSRDDGGRLRVRSPHVLGPYPATMTHCLAKWAERAPDRTFIAASHDLQAKIRDAMLPNPDIAR